MASTAWMLDERPAAVAGWLDGTDEEYWQVANWPQAGQWKELRRLQEQRPSGYRETRAFMLARATVAFLEAAWAAALDGERRLAGRGGWAAACATDQPISGGSRGPSAGARRRHGGISNRRFRFSDRVQAFLRAAVKSRSRWPRVPVGGFEIVRLMEKRGRGCAVAS
ncbi:hypothetical protein Dda_6364 [Drechslerella dactyloides]|uniref:Uncharacterized protein n=1 Tax=Drechslerella dactyloides TaxID=74499 RepID=A0AAD6NHC5_DREDA|nr:hypothetical protein Dda_6364 [Drechslerella dactyloides]